VTGGRPGPIRGPRGPGGGASRGFDRERWQWPAPVGNVMSSRHTVRSLTARKPLPRPVRHVTISRVALCATCIGISVAFVAVPRSAVCRSVASVGGHRATLRLKGHEADYLAVVRGLLQDSVWLHRNSAVVALPVRSSAGLGLGVTQRDREGGVSRA
jgi:hypothetical protein